MKKTYSYMTKDKKVKEIVGNAHKIKLANGEVIDVYTHKETTKDNKKYWCVSDAKTGMQIAGFYEYFSFIDYFDYENKEKTLLRIAKAKLDEVTKKTKYEEFRNKRLAQIKEEI